MSRYRLEPAPEQEPVLLRHCSDARYVWNLAVEQHAWWRPGRKSAPGYLEQSRQLTAARAASPWLREGSQTVQQQALRDFAQAMVNLFNGTRGRPGWRKAGLNREIGRSGWGALVRRLEDKAPGRVEKVPPAYTSQRCSACGHVARENRESQAAFLCTACGYACNADVNAARNIAAGHAVNARGGDRVTGPVNREPQLALLSA
jgi:transposase